MLKRHIKLHNKDYKSIGKSVQKVWNSLVKAGNKANGVSKLSQGLDKVGKFAAPLQAGMSVAGLGVDIYNTIEANKQMKEQMDLARKNFNLELEKQQKYELANNQLAASIDKAWGGSGEVAPTIDYSKYANYDMEQNKAGYWENKLGANSLVAGGAGRDENGNPTYMGANSNANARSIDSTQTNTDTELGGSGNMPTLSLGGAGGMPVGHSESIDTDNNDYEEGGTEAS
ncbi:hypothetical protein [Helicobacter bilis]|uniref:hypothetical protein n=1 Tax=Helicobacter bilis TaxID=37372 RepID=UPI00248F06F1|nr:hypothetical protein [Helicobacter bilis]